MLCECFLDIVYVYILLVIITFFICFSFNIITVIGSFNEFRSSEAANSSFYLLLLLYLLVRLLLLFFLIFLLLLLLLFLLLLLSLLVLLLLYRLILLSFVFIFRTRRSSSVSSSSCTFSHVQMEVVGFFLYFFLSSYSLTPNVSCRYTSLICPSRCYQVNGLWWYFTTAFMDPIDEK